MSYQGNDARNFTDTMQAGKDRAADRRNRGLMSGRAAKGWVRGTRRPEDGGPTGREIAHAYGILAVELAIEDHMRWMFPERYEAF